MFVSLIKTLNRNFVFKYLSSIKLAVPLMLVFAAALSWGTIVESKYNADMAKLMVYNAWWFQFLLILLWINIFCATISRIPFKVHHTGFVITHIGLLTLLIGGVITGSFGIDGQLRVVEGQTNNIVILPDLVLEVASMSNQSSQVYDLKRSLSVIDENGFSSLNSKVADRFQVLQYIPFAKSTNAYTEASNGEPAIEFHIKSQFFDVKEWLHIAERPFLQMGPAEIRFKAADNKDKKTSKVSAVLAKTTKKPGGAKPVFLVKEKGSNRVIAEIDPKDIKKKHKINNIEIVIKKVFDEAIVGNGGLYEGGTKGKNPAIEFELIRGTEKLREVSFAKFPTFSLSQSGTFDLEFQYESGLVESNIPDIPEHSNLNSSKLSSAQNVVEFTLSESESNKVMVELFKENQSILKKTLVIGEQLQTPWMGMVLTVNKLIPKSQFTKSVEAIEHPERSDLPQAALKIKPAGLSLDQSFWLLEGEPTGFSANAQSYEIYFGRRTFELPFRLTLERFTKKDYPGTEMAMSFESDVFINESEKTQKISMNEPLKLSGFTLYQSSYELVPGQTPASIFSVNHDPGRALKYMGSLILVLGIIIFTLMRSRIYREWRKKT